ncbi:MAG TPA: capsular polysaccharide synthesis protein [Stellaceae bacterium]|nr:capsular polysaccharide synthesis protein [Stellaceae bacterium]
MISDPDSAIPKTIYSMWAQGFDQAPPTVRMCLARWATLNPEYELRILQQADVDQLLVDVAIDRRVLPPQALSDILRARVLLTQGGVWVDASVYPVRPLRDWLPKFTRRGGFFAFDKPEPDRPLSSWFMAAASGHYLLERWWQEIERYWAKPRTLARYRDASIPDPGQIPPDPVREVAADGGASSDTYPYFWFHYLFAYLLERDAEFAAHWGRCTKRAATPTHRLLHLFGFDGRPAPAWVEEAMRGAPVHKLTWRRDYPIDLFETICRAIIAGKAAIRAA